MEGCPWDLGTIRAYANMLEQREEDPLKGANDIASSMNVVIEIMVAGHSIPRNPESLMAFTEEALRLLSGMESYQDVDQIRDRVKQAVEALTAKGDIE